MRSSAAVVHCRPPFTSSCHRERVRLKADTTKNGNHMWLLIAGVATFFLAHTAPFPFLLDRFAPKRSVWHMPSRQAEAHDGLPHV